MSAAGGRAAFPLTLPHVAATDDAGSGLGGAGAAVPGATSPRHAPWEAFMTGAQVKALRDALCEAFTPDSLRQMLRTELDRQLDTLAGPRNFQAVVFELIETADREGWSGLLLRGARHANPGSPALTQPPVLSPVHGAFRQAV
jgi:hypothetical protein